MSVLFFIYLIIKSFNLNLLNQPNYIIYINIIYNYYINKYLNKYIVRTNYLLNNLYINIFLLIIFISINFKFLINGDNNNFYKINAQEPVTPIAYGIIKLHDHILFFLVIILFIVLYLLRDTYNYGYYDLYKNKTMDLLYPNLLYNNYISFRIKN